MDRGDMAFTYFFRDSHTLELTVKHMAPEVMGRSRIRIWDAGCAMGPEPYTLAMFLREYSCACPGLNFSILATLKPCTAWTCRWCRALPPSTGKFDEAVTLRFAGHLFKTRRIISGRTTNDGNDHPGFLRIFDFLQPAPAAGGNLSRSSPERQSSGKEL